jgi:tRNA(Arg) A34 adenosine deaminase TadA
LLVIRKPPNSTSVKILSNSEPCAMCGKLIKLVAQQIRIRHVVFSDVNGNLVKRKLDELTGDHVTSCIRRQLRVGDDTMVVVSVIRQFFSRYQRGVVKNLGQ